MGVGVLQRTAQKAPVFQAGDEWAFLIWGKGGGRTAFVFALMVKPSFDGFTSTSWASRLRYKNGPIMAESQQERKARHHHVVELPETSAPEE
jgi:hypothetical protein